MLHLIKVAVFTVSMLVLTVDSATWSKRNPPIPSEFGDQKGCYIEEENKVIPFGSVLTPKGACYNLYCNEHIISYASCAVMMVGSGENCYKQDFDLTLPYPDCCPVTKCDDSNYV